MFKFRQLALFGIVLLAQPFSLVVAADDNDLARARQILSLPGIFTYGKGTLDGIIQYLKSHSREQDGILLERLRKNNMADFRPIYLAASRDASAPSHRLSSRSGSAGLGGAAGVSAAAEYICNSCSQSFTSPLGLKTYLFFQDNQIDDAYLPLQFCALCINWPDEQHIGYRGGIPAGYYLCDNPELYTHVNSTVGAPPVAAPPRPAAASAAPHRPAAAPAAPHRPAAAPAAPSHCSSSRSGSTGLGGAAVHGASAAAAGAGHRSFSRSGSAAVSAAQPIPPGTKCQQCSANTGINKYIKRNGAGQLDDGVNPLYICDNCVRYSTRGWEGGQCYLDSYHLVVEQ